MWEEVRENGQTPLYHRVNLRKSTRSGLNLVVGAMKQWFYTLHHIVSPIHSLQLMFYLENE